jgi:hypothetical protein
MIKASQVSVENSFLKLLFKVNLKNIRFNFSLLLQQSPKNGSNNTFNYATSAFESIILFFSRTYHGHVFH